MLIPLLMRFSGVIGRLLLAGVLLVLLPRPGRAQADEPLGVHAEMRAAAEALADVEPESSRPVPREGAGRTIAAVPAARPPLAVPSGAVAAVAARENARAVLQAAVHAAVRSEIERETQGSSGKSVAAVSTARRARAAHEETTGESGRSGVTRSNEAAAQSQMARRNQDVNQEKNRNVTKPLVGAMGPSAAHR